MLSISRPSAHYRAHADFMGIGVSADADIDIRDVQIYMDATATLTIDGIPEGGLQLKNFYVRENWGFLCFIYNFCRTHRSIILAALTLTSAVWGLWTGSWRSLLTLLTPSSGWVGDIILSWDHFLSRAGSRTWWRGFWGTSSRTCWTKSTSLSSTFLSTTSLDERKERILPIHHHPPLLCSIFLLQKYTSSWINVVNNK